MAELEVTPLAHEDLSHVVNYIAVNLANPDAAEAFLDDVDECYVYAGKSKDVCLLYRSPAFTASIPQSGDRQLCADTPIR